MSTPRNILRAILIGAVLGLCMAPICAWAEAMGDYLFAIVSGFAIEFVAVYWVHFCERGHKWRAGSMSALQALALVCGIELAGQSLGLKILFVLGYALGSVVGVTAKDRHANRGS